MSYNGSGTFLINTAGQPVVSGTVISSTAFNALTADLATGLSTAITKDGQTTVTANIPMGTYKFTGLGAGTAATDSANLSQVQSTVTKLLASVSGADTITAVGSPTLGAYAAGQMFYFVAASANTGAVTINIDSLGAKSITRDGTTALAAGDIQSGEVCVIVYDGTQFQLVNGASQSASIVTENLTVNKATVLNESGGDNDTRIEGDTDANLFFADASTDRIGIGTSSPAYKLDVSGAMQSSVASGNGAVYINNSSLSGKFWTFIPETSSGESNLLWYYGGTNAGTKLTLTNSGNLGLGVTPSAWDTLLKAIVVEDTAVFSGQTNSEGMRLGSNWYYNGGFKYQTTAAATRYDQASGAHAWFTAPSGTAGNNITFTQAMTLDASGQLALGRTSVTDLAANVRTVDMDGTAGAGFRLRVNGTATLNFYALSSAVYMAAPANVPIVFETNNTERARITSGGLLLVKRTTALDSGQIGLDFDGINNNGIAINDTASAGGSGLIKFLTGGTVRGSITNDNNTGVLYNQTSDERLKKNIANADDFGDVIDAIQVRKFDWKENDSHTRAGFVAQELVTVAPEAVYKPSKEEDMMGVDYSKLVPMLVKEIQSLRARVAALEAK